MRSATRQERKVKPYVFFVKSITILWIRLAKIRKPIIPVVANINSRLDADPEQACEFKLA